MKIIVKNSDGSRTEIRKVFPACCAWVSRDSGLVFTDSDVERMIASYKCDGAIIKKNKCSISIDATNI